MWRVKGVSMDNYTPLVRPEANWVIWSPNNDGIQKEPGHDLGYLVVVQVIPSILSLKRGMKGVGGRERVEKKDKKRTRMFPGHTQYPAVGGGNCSLSSYSPLIFELPKTWIIKAKRLYLGSV